MANRCDPSALKKGEWFSTTVYYKFTGSRHCDRKIEVKSSLGGTLLVSHNIIAQEMYSSTQVQKTKKVTRSEMARVLQDEVKSDVFTVTFEKKLTPKKVLDELESKGYKSGEPARKRRKIVNEALKGEERVLVGYLKDTQPFMGRSMAYDLNVEGPHNERQIDHRTLKELIVRNVRYVLK